MYWQLSNVLLSSRPLMLLSYNVAFYHFWIFLTQPLGYRIMVNPLLVSEAIRRPLLDPVDR